MSKILVLLPTYFLAAVFIYAGIDKIVHYDGFVNALTTYAVLPVWAAPHLAVPVILAEVTIGAGLFSRVWRGRCSLAASLLLVIFTAALAVNMVYRPGSLCGCWFTLTLGKATEMHIVQNILLLFVAVTGWWETSRTFTTRTLQAAPSAG